MDQRLALALFVAVVFVGGAAIGFLTGPGEWYAGLAKPPFNPPNWVFAPVWLILYVMIGVAGWRVWRREDGGAALVVWWVQLGLNFLWSPIFFAAQNIGLALAVIVALWLAIAVFIALAWRLDRPAAWLFAPYLAWVSFATLLNASIWWLN
jgi:tryptophan-rich sensory protein